MLATNHGLEMGGVKWGEQEDGERQGDSEAPAYFAVEIQSEAGLFPRKEELLCLETKRAGVALDGGFSAGFVFCYGIPIGSGQYWRFQEQTEGWDTNVP